ncbi:MAG: hypothetical protein H6636_05415 [Anaerolineales bacterium]|nr:hypothetical protein [Anaerolineales bacterium]
MKTFISTKILTSRFLISAFVLLGLLAPVPATLAAMNQTTIPTFFIQSVVKDSTVTIITYNFPANDTFNVTMGYMGTKGINGILVGTQASGAGGTITATYTIPAALQGQYQIAIRLESPTSGYYAFNWFYNNTAGTNDGTPLPTPTPGPTATPGPTSTPFVIPTFLITSVEKDSTVTITTANFPAGDTFNVRMNYMGTLGIGGTLVATQASGAGGSFSATYTIPDFLKGQYQIAIRLESPTSGYYAYNWFYNNTAGSGSGTPVPTPTNAPPITIPTFGIQSVVKDSTVTIITNNFPANDNFTVTMGYMGTKGINGIVVGSQASGTGGSFTATYTIPAALQGQAQIAIRLQSPTSGYYAYNWFYNNTAP